MKLGARAGRAALWSTPLWLAAAGAGAGGASPGVQAGRAGPGEAAAGPVLAADDFEGGLEMWSVVGRESNVRIVAEPSAAGDGNHVLELTPQRGEQVHVLLRASRGWSGWRMEGRLLFPTEGDGYLGLIYNHRQLGPRTDFGCLYLKSNGSYVRVSPHRDGNPSWRLYEELKVPLTGARRIETRRWYAFRLDVIGGEARLSLGDPAATVVRFDQLELESGQIGLEARPGGGEPVWVDDVVVRRLEAFPGVEAAAPAPHAETPVLTRWEVNGPHAAPRPEIEVAALATPEGWRPVEPDRRGMVISGRITERLGGDRHLAYFRTSLGAAAAGARDLVFSTANRLDVWLDGEPLATIEPQDYAWVDFLGVPEHQAARVRLSPGAGPRLLLVRVDGDRFAAGGFLAALETVSPD